MLDFGAVQKLELSKPVSRDIPHSHHLQMGISALASSDYTTPVIVQNLEKVLLNVHQNTKYRWSRRYHNPPSIYMFMMNSGAMNRLALSEWRMAGFQAFLDKLNLCRSLRG